DRNSLLRFGAARCARVYPVYALSLAIMLPIIAAELRLPERTGTQMHDKAALLANYGFLLQGWFGNLPVHWNTPAWSLSCELFFYFCFPLAALVLRSGGWVRLLGVSAVTLALPNLLAAFQVPQAW